MNTIVAIFNEPSQTSEMEQALVKRGGLTVMSRGITRTDKGNSAMAPRRRKPLSREDWLLEVITEKEKGHRIIAIDITNTGVHERLAAAGISFIVDEINSVRAMAAVRYDKCSAAVINVNDKEQLMKAIDKLSGATDDIIGRIFFDRHL